MAMTPKQQSETPAPSTDGSAKVCSCCSGTLPLSAFYSKGNRIDSRCKPCVLKSKASQYRRKKKAELRSRLAPVIGECAIVTETINDEAIEAVDCLEEQLHAYVLDVLWRSA